MFLVDPVRGSDGTYPGSPAGWSIVPVQELKSAVKFVVVGFGSVARSTDHNSLKLVVMGSIPINCHFFSHHEYLSMTHFKHYTCIPDCVCVFVSCYYCVHYNNVCTCTFHTCD